MLYGGVQEPLNGGVQLAAHIFEKDWKAPELIGAPKEQNLATEAGEMIGAIADVAIASEAVTAAAAAVGLVATTSGGAILVGALTLATAGAIIGAVSPVEGNGERDNYWSMKREQIAIDSAVFGVMGGTGSVLGDFFGKSLLGRVESGAVSGGLSGAVDSTLRAAFGDSNLDVLEDIGKWSLFGAGFGVAGWATDAVKGHFFEDSKAQIEANKTPGAEKAFKSDPMNNPPTEDTPGRGHWSAQADEKGNVEWIRKYPSGAKTLQDRVITSPDGTQETFVGQNPESAHDYEQHIVVKPNGYRSAEVAKPASVGADNGPVRTLIEQPDGTGVEIKDGMVTLINKDGSREEPIPNRQYIVRDKASQFPDQSINAKLDSLRGVTDGIDRNAVGTTTRPDGTVVTVAEHQTVWVKQPDGTVVIEGPKGKRFTGLADGTEIHEDGRGGRKVKFPGYSADHHPGNLEALRPAPEPPQMYTYGDLIYKLVSSPLNGPLAKAFLKSMDG